jgi:hypothetical protein
MGLSMVKLGINSVTFIVPHITVKTECYLRVGYLYSGRVSGISSKISSDMTSYLQIFKKCVI